MLCSFGAIVKRFFVKKKDSKATKKNRKRSEQSLYNCFFVINIKKNILK